MKTFFRTLAPLFLIISLACSCEGEPGKPGRDGKDGRDGAQVNTVLINVKERDWEFANITDNNYFVAEVDMPEITENVFDYGMVKMYRVYDFDLNTACQIELPYVRPVEIYLDDEDIYYSFIEVVDYELRIGKIYIYYTVSDFTYEEPSLPGDMQFRCAILL